jgi:hypothetical protein
VHVPRSRSGSFSGRFRLGIGHTRPVLSPRLGFRVASAVVLTFSFACVFALEMGCGRGSDHALEAERGAQPAPPTAADDKAADKPAVGELHCYHGSTDPKLVQPLMSPSMHLCYDDTAACRKMVEEHGGECTPSGTPAWHCFSMSASKPTRDPMNGITTCFPTQEMCEASRELSPLVENGTFVLSPCSADETVYCTMSSASNAVQCFSEQSWCDLTRTMVAKMMHDAPEMAACTPRTTAGPR